MSILAAERRFNQGLVALAEGRHADAVAALREALDVEQRRSAGPPSARYLSYYGLSLARSGRATGEALDACHQAVEREPGKPVYFLNLGRVHLATGRRALAFECFRRGLTLAPDYRPLLEELARLDRRTRPISPFPRRAGLLGRLIGRARRRPVRRQAA